MNYLERIGMTEKDVDVILNEATALRENMHLFRYYRNPSMPEIDALKKGKLETVNKISRLINRVRELPREARQEADSDPYGIGALKASNQRLADSAAAHIEWINGYVEEQQDRLFKYHYRTAKESEVPEKTRVIAEAATEIVSELLFVPIELNLILP